MEGPGADAPAAAGDARSGRVASLDTRGTAVSHSASSERNAAGAAPGAPGGAAYARLSSFESRDSAGWLARVVVEGIRDKSPERRAKKEGGDAAAGVSDESDGAGEDAAGAGEAQGAAAGPRGGGEAGRDGPRAARGAEGHRRTKRSISLDAAIDAQSKRKSKAAGEERPPRSSSKLGALYEANDSFVDIVGRRIPCLIDAWSRRAGTVAPSSLIQVWANEYWYVTVRLAGVGCERSPPRAVRD